jgi:hypothetical protein
MRVEPSKLAQLVIAYQERFGGHVPARVLRLLDAGDLVPILLDALATNKPLAETGRAPMEFSSRGCITDRETPTKLPSGKWLH